MTAQTLFEIATDLGRIQVEASVPEADIGRIQQGQPVGFTVDAYEAEFTGRVEQVRLAAATTQNVVTYPVVIRAENPDRKLFPGMTANISCETARRDRVLRIPNAALRFRPDSSDSAGSEDRAGDPAARPSGPDGFGPGVWVLDSGTRQPRRVEVRIGISDGIFTEILDPAADGAEKIAPPTLREGDELITGYDETNGKPSAQATVNPFAPVQPGSGGRRRRP
jgi:HlyD family secretion protein